MHPRSPVSAECQPSVSALSAGVFDWLASYQTGTKPFRCCHHPSGKPDETGTGHMRDSVLRQTSEVTTRVEPRHLLSIGVVNGLRLSVGNDPLPLANRKARAILAFLALENAPAVPRERLATLFWSESSERHARSSLRQTLFELREALAVRGSQRLAAAARRRLPGSGGGRC